jgi:hypothetical protein
MRIFERLRGGNRSDSAIARRLFETVTDDLLRKLEDGTSVPTFPESESTCCSCCSAEETARQGHRLR